MKFNLKVFVVCLVLVFGVAFLGNVFMGDSSSSSWYLESKPSFTPPGFVFGIVWPILYFLIAFSLYFAWIKAKKSEKKILGIVFGINLIANTFWTLLFFGLQNPLFGFVDLILILISSVFMVYFAGKIDKKSGWFLVPYFLWLCFAGVLNFAFLI